jgi:hypothetical protein
MSNAKRRTNSEYFPARITERENPLTNNKVNETNITVGLSSACGF